MWLKLQLMTNRKSHNYGLSIDTKIDALDHGWPWTAGQILLEFRDISRVSEAITAKRMKTDRVVSDGIVAH